MPVAGTDIVGIRDAVGPAGESWLAPPGDADTLAQKLITLLRDEQTRQILATQLQHRIQTEFAPQTMCEQMMQLIQMSKVKTP